MQHHKYSLTELENMMPWEREIYMGLLMKWIQEEMEMNLEFKRKELEDADARRDAMRKMTWFALGGMLLYPFAVVLAIWLGLDQGGKILGDMASVYFVSVAAIVAAFYGSQALSKK